MSTGSTYTTSREAAVARAKMLKLEKPPQKRVSTQELLERVSLLREVYMPVTGKAWLPADLQSMFEHARKAHMMFTTEPALEVLNIQLQYAPWRHALLASWKQRNSTFTPTRDIEVSSVDDSDLHARASRLHCALTHTINCVAQTHMPMCWVNNCSHTVGRQSAPQMVLHHVGLLRKVLAFVWRMVRVQHGDCLIPVARRRPQ